MPSTILSLFVLFLAQPAQPAQPQILVPFPPGQVPISSKIGRHHHRD